MKINLLLALLVATTLNSCDTKKPATEESTDNASADSDSILAGVDNSQRQCYALMTAGDTIRLSLTQRGIDVSGSLQYMLAEKDQNTGTLRGQIRGDTLIADYTFQSEGVESVREVVFLTKAGGLVEGYGDVQEQNGKMIFTPNAPLTFNTNEVLTRTPCNNE